MRLPHLTRPFALILLCAAISATACSSADDKPLTDDTGTANNAVNNVADGGNDNAANSDLTTLGEFEVGTNPVDDATAGGFVLMTDGAEVPFTFGVQGSWMVVLAFRTHDMIDGEFDVRANISLDGVPSGEIWLEAQETFPGGDGWDYYYSLFLPIDDEPPAQGSPIHIEMSVTDGAGTTAALEHDVLAGPADGP